MASRLLGCWGSQWVAQKVLTRNSHRPQFLTAPDISHKELHALQVKFQSQPRVCNILAFQGKCTLLIPSTLLVNGGKNREPSAMMPRGLHRGYATACFFSGQPPWYLPISVLSMPSRELLQRMDNACSFVDTASSNGARRLSLWQNI